MRLRVQNIGKLREADIELNGITVIAGENNTGKSTVGKVLYCIFNSFYNLERQIERVRRADIGRWVETLHWNINPQYRGTNTDIADQLMKNANNLKYSNSIESLREDLVNLFAVHYGDDFLSEKYNENFNEIAINISHSLSVSDEQIIKAILGKKFEREFAGRINNIYSDDISLVELIIKSEKVSLEIADDKIRKFENNFMLKTEVIYIDDPFVVDNIYYGRRLGFPARLNDHRDHLISKLVREPSKENVVSEIVVNNKLKDVLDKVNSVCAGDIKINNRGGLEYTSPKSDRSLNVYNISTGLKTFVILKILLQNGVVENNGTIILDEPEIHLHPEWQLLFAEIIVLLQKDFGLNILLNTHSPYFLEAIEVYSQKYGIEGKCRYYLAENDGVTSSIFDVTENTEEIYNKLARPLQVLENERYQND